MHEGKQTPILAMVPYSVFAHMSYAAPHVAPSSVSTDATLVIDPVGPAWSPVTLALTKWAAVSRSWYDALLGRDPTGRFSSRYAVPMPCDPCVRTPPPFVHVPSPSPSPLTHPEPSVHVGMLLSLHEASP